jgi:hypothetical protein
MEGPHGDSDRDRHFTKHTEIAPGRDNIYVN